MADNNSDDWSAVLKKERESINMSINTAAYRLNVDAWHLEQMGKGRHKIKPPSLLLHALHLYQATIFTRIRAHRWIRAQYKEE